MTKDHITGIVIVITVAFSTLTLLVGQQEGQLACKYEWWGTSVVICLGR